MKKRTVFLTFMVLAFVSAAGCTWRSVETKEFGDVLMDRNRILVATAYSDFKSAVVDDITETLSSDGSYVRIIDVDYLKDENPVNYDAILIVDTCVAWSLSGDVLNFIESVKEKDKVIVLATAGDPDWSADLAPVDAMTSASLPERSNQVASLLISKVREKVASNR